MNSFIPFMRWTMKFDSFEEWKTSVVEMNTQATEIAENREVAIDKMQKQLMRIFSENGMPVSSIIASKDAFVFEVHLIKNTSNEILFPRQLIMDLGVSFSVERQITKTAEQELFIKIYPLDD